MTRHAAVLLGLLVAASAACVAAPEEARQRTFAHLPNWTGLWIADDGIMTRLGLRNDVEGDGGPTFKDRILSAHPPYNAEWEAKYRQGLAALAYRTSGKECGFHFPGVMESPWVFEVLITPEQTAFIFAGREIRHVYTDGRSHPPSDELWPLPWGDSIGHWEGATLTVETVSVQQEAGLSPHAPMLSATARFSERIHKVSKDRLEDVMTITDPVTLTRPWTLTIPYTRVTSIDRLFHGDCMENDRNPVVDGKVTVTEPQPK